MSVAALAWAAGACVPAFAEEPDPCVVTPCDEFGCGKWLLAQRAGVIDEDPIILDQMAEAMTDTDVLSNNLQIELTPATKVIAGFNQMTVRSVNNGLTQFTFNLRSNYTISSVVLNEGTPGAVTIPGAAVTSVGNYGRRINLDRTYNANETFTVKVNYSGTAVSINGSIEFTTLNGQTLIYTLSQPYYAGTWWPCKDGDALASGDNADKATLTMWITVPSTLKVTGTGVLQGVDALSGSRSRYRIQSSYPIPSYLVAFGAHPYNTYNPSNPGAGATAADWTYTHAGGTMPMEINISPGSDTSGNRAAWRQSIAMMNAFRPVLGEYPFIAEKYGKYQFGFSGGMEHQTNSGMGGFSESLVAHEMAHQWLGDWVTCRTWNDIWINEGGATYFEAVWQERKVTPPSQAALFIAMANRRPSSLDGSCYVYTPNDFNRIFSSNFSYRKGAWVYHMLRKILGEQGFVDFLAALRNTYGGSALTSADFQAVAEGVYGASLSWFFQPWVYEVGGPSYSTAFRNITVNGQGYVEFYLNQSQNAAWPTFTMPIDLVLDGSTTWPIWNTARSQWYLRPVSAAVGTLEVDPSNWILTGSKGTVPFVEGPPKIITVTPAPGSTLSPSGASVDITFHKNVTAPAGAFTLSGPGGSVGLSVAYSATTQTATVTPLGTLPAGAYTLTVGTGVNAGGLALDGENTAPASSAGLPTGDGLAGGPAVFSFTVAPSACNLADVTNIGGGGPPDGQLTVDDLIAFVNIFSDGTGCPGAVPCSGADVVSIGGSETPDGQLTVDDVIAFVNAFSDGC